MARRQKRRKCRSLPYSSEYRCSANGWRVCQPSGLNFEKHSLSIPLEWSGEILVDLNIDVLRADGREVALVVERPRYAKEGEEISEKTRRHLTSRFPCARVREQPRRESNPVRLRGGRVCKMLVVWQLDFTVLYVFEPGLFIYWLVRQSAPVSSSTAETPHATCENLACRGSKLYRDFVMGRSRDYRCLASVSRMAETTPPLSSLGRCHLISREIQALVRALCPPIERETELSISPKLFKHAHPGELDSIPSGVTPGFPRVGVTQRAARSVGEIDGGTRPQPGSQLRREKPALLATLTREIYPGTPARNPFASARICSQLGPAGGWGRRDTDEAAKTAGLRACSSRALGSLLADDRPIMNAVEYRIVSRVVWTNRAMLRSGTDANRTGVLAVVDIGSVYSRAGRCRWSAGFLSDLPFHSPLHSIAAPYSPRFALIGSQDLDVESRQNLSTVHCIAYSRLRNVARRLVARISVCRKLKFETYLTDLGMAKKVVLRLVEDHVTVRWTDDWRMRRMVVSPPLSERERERERVNSAREILTVIRHGRQSRVDGVDGFRRRNFLVRRLRWLRRRR
ncbi:hypothetical protein PR048_003627 [Dryococelus australis]|uniref:Uncharacterized protein n=1 Tax=Dryococelus australis TaxID=614101 RepID=A0ABQ9IP60_9NEOP|nr:hypothetical protein PR048_003627 [Dryococelus australis]